ncbi:MAG: acyloxyacyl hydrolase, partial [Bacteroidales bacterium]|nr:acyloxyacyl hydrolase [Bacteroidales bacterium]
YDFTKNFSVRVSYMRPVRWVKYDYILDGDLSMQPRARTIWMNEAGLFAKRQFHLNKSFSVYTEGGFNIITRHGFSDEAGPVVSHAKFSSPAVGAGVKYHVGEHWGLSLSTLASPGNRKYKQPYTTFVGTGFSYNFLPFNERQLAKTIKRGYIFPKQILQFGFATNVLGYGVNNAVSSNKFPIFWGGDAQVHHGFSFTYQRNVFHGARAFALDWGANASFWTTDIKKDNFYTLSLFPVFKVMLFHSKPMDAYFYYSVAGPTYISKTILDDNRMGEHFTFQDNMGTGVYFGAKRNYNAEIRIGHYSNGNLYPYNEAAKIPLTFCFGYAFQ